MARIVVVGAGIAGLATAVALQRRGHDVTVIEERTDTATGAGISIWPNALAALDHIGLGDAVRAAGGAVTAGALRWRDGSWPRHPSAERIVKALGEPLVVVRRSALTDILAGALAGGTVRNGVAVRELAITGAGVRITLSDSTTRVGGRRHWRGRHPFGGGPPSQRRTEEPLRRLYGLARSGRLCDRPRIRRRSPGPGHRVRACSARAGPHLLVRHRTGAGRREGTRKGTGVSADHVRLLGRADPGGPGRDRPADVLRNDLYDRDQARVWSTGRCWSWATPPTRCGRTWARAAVRGWRTPRYWPTLSTAPTTWRRRSPGSRRFGGDGCARSSANRTTRPDPQPATRIPERRGEPRLGPCARGGADPASGEGGGAVGVCASDPRGHSEERSGENRGNGFSVQRRTPPAG